jgi:hypothetical protein
MEEFYTRCQNYKAQRLNLKHYHNYIDKYTNENDSKPVSIYVGSGTASNLPTDPAYSNLRTVSESNYQQFPPTIKNMFKSVGGAMFIFLIDPHLETPAYITQDRELHRELDLNLIEVKEFNDTQMHKFTTPDLSHELFVISMRFFATIGTMRNKDEIDITLFIASVCNMAVSKDLFFFYNSFAGERVEEFSDLSTMAYKNHLNHIVFGFPTHSDYGCYPNLKEPELNFVYSMEQGQSGRTFISVLNPQDYIENMKPFPLELIKENFSRPDQDICMAHFNRIKRDFISEFNNLYVSFLRKIKLKHTDFDYCSNLSINERKEISDMITKEEFDLAFARGIEIIRTKIDSITTFLNSSSMDVIEHCIQNESFYKWNISSNFFD